MSHPSCGHGASPGQPADDEPPVKIVYPLEHAYTPAALGFGTLKGADAGVAGVLAAAAQDSDADLHLALFTFEESGWAEHVSYGRSHGRWDSYDDEEEDEFEVGEVTDCHAGLDEWRRQDGTPSPLGEIPVEEHELSPPTRFDEMEPDEEHFREATGNEGASFERTYSRAALVLWPRTRFFAVLSQAGLKVTLPCLEDMVERWTAGGGDGQTSVRSEARSLAGHMLSGWPMERWHTGRHATPTRAARMLTLLAKLEDTDLIRDFLTRITAGGDYSDSDNEAIITAAHLLTEQQARSAIERIISGNVATSLCGCGNLLLRAVEALPDVRFDGAARLLTGAVATPPDKTSYRDEVPDPDFVVDLMTALDRIDPELADRTVGLMLDCSAHYGLDDILLPAACRQAGPGTTKSPAAQRLLAACRAASEQPHRGAAGGTEGLEKTCRHQMPVP